MDQTNVNNETIVSATMPLLIDPRDRMFDVFCDYVDGKNEIYRYYPAFLRQYQVDDDLTALKMMRRHLEHRIDRGCDYTYAVPTISRHLDRAIEKIRYVFDELFDKAIKSSARVYLNTGHGILIVSAQQGRGNGAPPFKLTVGSTVGAILEHAGQYDSRASIHMASLFVNRKEHRTFEIHAGVLGGENSRFQQGFENSCKNKDSCYAELIKPNE